MKIEILSDVFDIVKRVKSIDKDYYILFDKSKHVYELHHKKQSNSYCFSHSYKFLDKMFLDMVYYTSTRNIVNIIRDIDNNNNNMENDNLNKRIDCSSYMVGEIYNFSANTSKKYNNNAFSTIWR